MKKFLILLFSFLIFPFLLSATTAKENTINSIKSQLSKADNPKDSLRLLFDLWDLSPRKDHLSIGHQIYNIAGRSKNTNVQLDIVRQMASAIDDDSTLNVLKKMASRIPESDNQKETILFINIKRIATSARYMDEDSRQAKIAEILSKDDYSKLDKYKKVERLFSICEYLSNYIEGDLLIKYLKDLNKIMDEEGVDSYPIRNTFYSESANIFTATGSHKQAVEADRKLLSIINQLEKEYKSKGRRYRNYDVARFISYRRMLSNYEALTVEEVNEIYDKILQLAASNQDIKDELDKNKRTAAYHAMKNGNYVEAIALIKNQVKKEKSMPIRRQMYQMLIQAAKETGDKHTLELAENEYAQLKKAAEEQEIANSYNDLRVRYKVNMLLTDNARLELKQKNEQIKSAKTTMIFIIVGWIVVVLALITTLVFWARHRNALAHLSNFIQVLSDERTELKARRYGSTPRQVKTAHRQLPIESENKSVKSMIDYILNDIMYISSIGLDMSDNFIEKIDMGTFMRNAHDTLTAHLKKNVKVNFKYPDPDFYIEADKLCLEWLTEHILKTAVRLSPEGGEVGLECVRDGNFAKIIYTHSGDSLPGGKEELVFKNFITYEDLAKNEDAALKYCRMIHFLLDSTLRSDREVSYGRLILTIPLHQGLIPEN